MLHSILRVATCIISTRVSTFKPHIASHNIPESTFDWSSFKCPWKPPTVRLSFVMYSTSEDFRTKRLTTPFGLHIRDKRQYHHARGGFWENYPYWKWSMTPCIVSSLAHYYVIIFPWSDEGVLIVSPRSNKSSCSDVFGTSQILAQLKSIISYLARWDCALNGRGNRQSDKVVRERKSGRIAWTRTNWTVCFPRFRTNPSELAGHDELHASLKAPSLIWGFTVLDDFIPNRQVNWK